MLFSNNNQRGTAMDIRTVAVLSPAYGVRIFFHETNLCDQIMAVMAVKPQ